MAADVQGVSDGSRQGGLSDKALHGLCRVFKEFREGREILLDASERVGIYLRLVTLMKEYFGGDNKGRKKAFYFLPWHFNFFYRYR